MGPGSAAGQRLRRAQLWQCRVLGRSIRNLRVRERYLETQSQPEHQFGSALRVHQHALWLDTAEPQLYLKRSRVDYVWFPASAEEGLYAARGLCVFAGLKR